MASDKSHQQVTSTDSGEKSIEIQPINETQKERDLATFVTTHSPSFLSQAQNSSLIPEKNAALISSNPSSSPSPFGSTFEDKNIKNDLILDKAIISNIETKMESNNSKDKQDVKPALPTGWKPSSNSFSSGNTSVFNKPSANPTTLNNNASAPKIPVTTFGSSSAPSKDSKPQEKSNFTAYKPSIPTGEFGSMKSGTTNLGAGASQSKPLISNASQNPTFNMSKSSQDIKSVFAVNMAQGAPKENPTSAFGVSKPITNLTAGAQASKSDKPLGINNNGSNFSSQNTNVTKNQGSISSSTSVFSKDPVSTTIPPTFKTTPSVLPASSPFNVGSKDTKNNTPLLNQSSAQATNKNIVPGTVQFSIKSGGSNIANPYQDNNSGVSNKINTSSASVQSSNKPTTTINPITFSSTSAPKKDSSTLGKVTENNPISGIGQSYTSRPQAASNQSSLPKPVSTPVAQPTVSKPVLPEVTQSTTPKPTPPKVTESTISNPAPQSNIAKPVLPTVIQPFVSKPVSSSASQISATEKTHSAEKQNIINISTSHNKGIISTQYSQKDNSVSNKSKNDISTHVKPDQPKASIIPQSEKDSKLPAPALSKNLSNNNKDKVSRDFKDGSKVVSSQNQAKKEITKLSEKHVINKIDDSKKSDINKTKVVSNDEFKKPSDMGSKEIKASVLSSEGLKASKPISEVKAPSKNLSVSFSNKEKSESAKNTKDIISTDKSNNAPGTKRSSEELTKKPDVKSPKKVKKTKSGTFINEIPDRKDMVGELFICGKGPSQLGVSKKNAEFLELTPIDKLPSNIVDVSCGLNHTLALTSEGDIYSWGVNSKNALGRNGETSIPTKVTFDEEVVVVQIVAGNSFSAALTDSGKAYAWGTFLSDNEVLGFYESAGKSQETPVNIGDKLPKGTEFTQIVAGKDHLLLLTTKGRIYAMGDMKYGQLGVRMLRKKKNDHIPQGLRLNCLSLMNVVQIAAGGYHSFAINKKDEVFSWGQNNYYQCGIPSSSPSYDVTIEIPTKSVSIMNLGECSIFGGDYFTLALNEDGELYGFGLAEGGLLGVPMETTSFATIKDKKVLEEPEHIIFPNSAEVTHVATGSNHSIVYAASKLYSWGTESAATGHSTAVTSPTIINSSGSENLIMLSAGYQHSTFLFSSSDAMC